MLTIVKFLPGMNLEDPKTSGNPGLPIFIWRFRQLLCGHPSSYFLIVWTTTMPLTTPIHTKGWSGNMTVSLQRETYQASSRTLLVFSIPNIKRSATVVASSSDVVGIWFE